MSLLGSYHIPIKCNRKTLLVILLFLLWICPNVKAQNPTEQEVKAVFIYNFVNFVEWPASSFRNSSDPFVIGIAGADNYSSILREVVKGESYQGRSIQVRNIVKADEIEMCNILYIDKAHPTAEEIMASTENKPILTISDMDNFMNRGGMIRFFLEESKVKIEINQEQAQKNKLTISAKLLRLAKMYKQ